MSKPIIGVLALQGAIEPHKAHIEAAGAVFAAVKTAKQFDGVDGFILPDLPMFEYLETYKPVFDQYGLYNIFLITPQTSEARIREINDNSHGFIYMVSSASTTGARASISADQSEYFARVKGMNLKNPTLIGFGISNAETFDKACDNANGAIIGSAFIKAISQEGELKENIETFVKSVIG